MSRPLVGVFGSVLPRTTEIGGLPSLPRVGQSGAGPAGAASGSRHRRGRSGCRHEAPEPDAVYLIVRIVCTSLCGFVSRAFSFADSAPSGLQLSSPLKADGATSINQYVT